MIGLKPTVDYSDVAEIKDLPVFWVSADDADIDGAGAYERSCKQQGEKPDPDELKKILGGSMVHLRQTTLRNGIRFVTIHKEDGTEIFDDHEYGGLISCNCGAIHDSVCVTAAHVIRDIDLGDGFNLSMTISGVGSRGYGSTSSFVEKKFSVQGKEVEVHQTTEPASVHDAGHLMFQYKIWEPSKQKLITVGIHTPSRDKTGGRNHPNCESSVKVAFNLSTSRYESSWDQVEFKFGIDGRLIEIVGISQESAPNPEWKDQDMLHAIKKGGNSWFHYTSDDHAAHVFSQQIFGKDIVSMQQDTGMSLTLLMKSAIQELDIDLAKVLVFR